jgi:hypothetical protein
LIKLGAGFIAPTFEHFTRATSAHSSSRASDGTENESVVLRKQYHFRPSSHGFRAWSVERLATLARSPPVQEVALEDISEIDEPYWFSSEGEPTCREIAEHARLIDEADLAWPIILSSNKRVMDGMHRVLKALNLGQSTIRAVIFEVDPEPDYVDVQPDDLPY